MTPQRFRAPAFEDLTARARIRDVALAHFARHGAKGTTLRGVAEDAGVSPGLVQHHFRTKRGLREACDAYVVDYLRRGVKEGITEHGLGDPHFLAATYHSAPPVLRYLARALTDGSPAAAVLFDEMVGLTEDYLSGHGSGAPDTRAQAAVLTAMKLGTVVLHTHLSRALSADTLTPAGLPRVRAAMLDIVAEEFSGPELTGLLRAGVEQHQHHGTAATPAATREARP